MGVYTIGLRQVWNKDGYGRKEYDQREMFDLKKKWAVGKMNLDFTNDGFGFYKFCLEVDLIILF